MAIACDAETPLYSPVNLMFINCPRRFDHRVAQAAGQYAGPAISVTFIAPGRRRRSW